MRRGLAPSRSVAARLIGDRQVIVSGSVADKPARMVDAGEPVVLAGPPPQFVGRGGNKLEAALERFGIDPEALRVLDAGASTGGFTDCLLQRGALAVTALDVGHGQLHEKLRADPRVEVVERTNVRHLDPTTVVPYDAVVADLSFIWLRAVIDVLGGATQPGGWLGLLWRPKAAAGRPEAARGGAVSTDPEVWRRTVDGVLDAAQEAGAAIMGVMVSPLHGADGNTEFLVHLRRVESAPGSSTEVSSPKQVEAVLDAALAAAAASLSTAEEREVAEARATSEERSS